MCNTYNTYVIYYTNIFVSLGKSESRIHRELLQLSIWAKGLNRHFTKEDELMTKKKIKIKNAKRCSTSVVLREMQIKTTQDTTTNPLDRLKFKRLIISSFGKDVEKYYHIVLMKI